MKNMGIIGGIGPESTIEYYRLILAKYRELVKDGSYPPLLVNSIDLKKMLDLIKNNELAAVTEYLVREVDRLARAGAELGLLAANTPHVVFDDIRRQSSIPMVSIVEATCEEARKLGITRVGLFGTRFTMGWDFYSKVFSEVGITLVVPNKKEQDYIHDKYMNELVLGIVRAETRVRLLGIADRMEQQESIQGLILGGTELALILRDSPDRGIPFLDTTRIHAEAAVALMLGIHGTKGLAFRRASVHLERISCESQFLERVEPVDSWWPIHVK